MGDPDDFFFPAASMYSRRGVHAGPMDTQGQSHALVVRLSSIVQG